MLNKSLDVGPTPRGRPTERATNRSQADAGQGNEGIIIYLSVTLHY